MQCGAGDKRAGDVWTDSRPVVSTVCFFRWSHLLSYQQCSDRLLQGISHLVPLHWDSQPVSPPRRGSSVSFLCGPGRLFSGMLTCSLITVLEDEAADLLVSAWCHSWSEKEKIVVSAVCFFNGDRRRWVVAVLQAVRRNGCRDSSPGPRQCGTRGDHQPYTIVSGGLQQEQFRCTFLKPLGNLWARQQSQTFLFGAAPSRASSSFLKEVLAELCVWQCSRRPWTLISTKGVEILPGVIFSSVLTAQPPHPLCVQIPYMWSWGLPEEVLAWELGFSPCFVWGGLSFAALGNWLCKFKLCLLLQSRGRKANSFSHLWGWRCHCTPRATCCP